MFYKTGFEIFYNEVSSQKKYLPLLSPKETNQIEALFNRVTVLADELNNQPPLVQFFMFRKKKNYKDNAKEFLELIDFWAIPIRLDRTPYNVVTTTKETWN